MKHLFHWVYHHTGAVLVCTALLLHLISINQYGLTWDFHFHFFGGGHLLGYSWQQLDPRPLPYVEPDPRLAWTLPYGAIMSVPPVVSFLLLHKTLHMLPSDAAYHLPIILWGVGGIAVLFLFTKNAAGRRAGILAALFLALMPRYIGDLHNNMKDVPSAVVFALNMWVLWRFVRRRRIQDLLLAALVFAVAFNIKINSIFIPVVFAAWLITAYGFKLIKQRFSRLFFWYAILAPLAAFLLWWTFWPDPIAQLFHAYRTFGIGTNNIEVLLHGQWYCSGSTVPWYYPFWYLAITTPLPVLTLFFVGSITTLIRLRNGAKHAAFGLLCILWFLLPLSRYVVPTIGVIDGIRHFEEVLFPVAALAALGLDEIIRILARTKRSLVSALLLGIFAWLLWIPISYHPYEIVYFNEMVGGARGAFGKYDLDYWGTSQKAAVSWVNAHAPLRAKIAIPMAADIAGTYLRSDLLANLNKYGYDESDFVIILNRQSFYYRFFYVYEYLLHHAPAYTVSVQGAPLTWVFDNRTDNKTPRQTPWWNGEDPCIRPYWKGVR